jgi:hypothetical protein
MNKMIIIKVEEGKVQFLRHEGHNHFWTKNRTEAMEYTRRDIAQGLAEKYGGEVKDL